MQRTLDDIEGRFVVVLPEEGVSLATLGAFIDPVAEPNIWRDDNTTPAWHIGTAQEPDDTGAFENARVFAPIPSSMPVTLPEVAISFADLARTIDPAADPNVWQPLRTESRYAPDGAGISAVDLARMISSTANPTVWREDNGTPTDQVHPWYLEGALVPEGRDVRAASGTRPGVIEDIGRTLPSAAASGTAKFLGQPGDIGDQWFKGWYGLAELLEEKLGLPKGWAAETRRFAEMGRPYSPTAGLPTSTDIRENIERVTGPLYQSRTPIGKYVGAGVEGIPNAFGGGFLANLLKFGIAPGVLGEAASQASQDTAAEHWARPGTELAASVLAMLASRHPSRAELGAQPNKPRTATEGDERGIYAFPKEPEIPLKEYYRGRPVETDEFGNILRTPEDHLLNRNAIVIGSENTKRPQRVVTPGELNRIVKEKTGAYPERLPESRMDRSLGFYDVDKEKIFVWDALKAGTRHKTVGHEFGHHIVKKIPAMVTEMPERVKVELAPLYSWGYKGKRVEPLETPMSMRYAPEDAAEELIVEAIRAYLTNPNYLKKVAPEAAAFIRKHVNPHPEFRDILQFNNVAGFLPLGGLGVLGLGAASQTGDGRTGDNDM